MHSAKSLNGTTFHYNSDLSGDVIIRTKAGAEIEVDGEDLKQFIAQRLVAEKISKLESMDPVDALLNTR